MEIEGGTTDWEKEDLVSPWDKGPSPSGNKHHWDSRGLYLEVAARDFDIKGDEAAWSVVLDCKSDVDRSGFKCAIVGRESSLLVDDGKGDRRTYYVLIVKPSETDTSVDGGIQLYERVGVAAIPGKWINMVGDGLKIKIQ